MFTDPTGYVATSRDLMDGLAINEILAEAMQAATTLALNIYWKFRAAIPAVMMATTGMLSYISNNPALLDVCTRLTTGDLTSAELQQEFLNTFTNIQQTIWDHIYEITNRSSGPSNSNGGSTGGNGSSGNWDPDKIRELLSRAQKKTIDKLDSIFNNHMKDSDFEAVKNKLAGHKYPKPNGGYWDHISEMKNAHIGLQNSISSLQGTLKNSQLQTNVREVLTWYYERAIGYVSQIDELFKPYGGIDAF